MQKFKRIVKTGPPTGDPNCPENIQRAKRLSSALFRNLEIGTRINSESETKTNNDNDNVNDGNNDGNGNNRHEEELEIVTLGQLSQESSPGPRKSPRKQVTPVLLSYPALASASGRRKAILPQQNKKKKHEKKF